MIGRTNKENSGEARYPSGDRPIELGLFCKGRHLGLASSPVYLGPIKLEIIKAPQRGVFGISPKFP